MSRHKASQFYLCKSFWDLNVTATSVEFVTGLCHNLKLDPNADKTGQDKRQGPSSTEAGNWKSKVKTFFEIKSQANQKTMRAQEHTGNKVVRTGLMWDRCSGGEIWLARKTETQKGIQEHWEHGWAGSREWHKKTQENIKQVIKPKKKKPKL